MFSFPVLLLACYVGAEWSASPPTIDVGDEVVVRPEDQDYFQLRCEGHRRVFWNWSTSLPQDADVIETQEQENNEYRFVSTLTIHKPHSNHTGLYHCHYENATTREEDTDNVATTHVFIYAAPSVEVRGIPDYLQKWDTKEDKRLKVPTLSVTCLVQGFPIPTILWKYQACPYGPSSCNDFEDTKTHTPSEWSLDYSGNVIMSNMTFTPKVPGYLWCLANNSLGTVNSTVPVVVSDLFGQHLFYLLYFDKTYRDLTASPVFNVTINDIFVLVCAARKFHYTAVMLLTPPGYVYEVIDKSRSDRWIMMTPKGRNRTTKSMEGKYSCIAVRHDNTTEIKNVTISVMGVPI